MKCLGIGIALLAFAGATATAQQAVPVRYTPAAEHSVRSSVRLPGTVTSRVASVVAAEAEGLVVSMDVIEGEAVRKGQPLAHLRTIYYEIRLRAANGGLKEAQARLQLAERNLRRAEDLLADEVISQEDLDDAISEFTAWQGRDAQSLAQIDELELALDRCVIRAPYDGVVVDKRTDVGQWLKLGGEVIELIALDQLEVRVDIPERYYRQISAGADVAVKFEALPGVEVAGRIAGIIPAADARARTFPINVTIPNEGRVIGAGMLAEVALPVGEPYPAVVVPKDAVMAAGGAEIVYRIKEDGTVEPVPVTRGAGVGAWIAIEGPIASGEKIVTRGNERLRPGQAVEGALQEYRLPVKIIQQAIRFPVTTTVGVILLVMFGAIALFRLPIQLTPTVEDPIITVSTVWPGASPVEIEQEIVQEQEDQLKSLEGLTKMESESSDSFGSITLTFQVGTDLDSALLRVSNLLEQVPEYPEDADKPVIRSVDQAAGAIAWFVMHAKDDNGFEGDIATLFDFMDDFIKPEFERVPGVAASAIFGGTPHEMHVKIDPAKLASRAVTINEVATALDRENRDFSGGDFNEGKRRYIVRTVGEYQSAEDIDEIVVAVRNGVPVYLRDVGHAEMGFYKPGARVFNKGRPILAINASKEAGSNILEVMAGLKEAVEYVNRERLDSKGLELFQVYDETEYVYSAIQLVLQSLLIGGTLAILVLLVYLRSMSSTLVVAVAIPISVIGGFLALNTFGRTLNVISLAGMAFAAGMVVDNSIVVLENIYRHRQMGKSRAAAAFDGASEVWGAVLASTLTTIAVFVPVLFIEGEVGQLFGDIALAISCAVGLSLVVAITVIPSLAAKVLGGAAGGRKTGLLQGLTDRAAGLRNGVGDVVYRITGSTTASLLIVLGFTGGAIGLSFLLVPKAEYLPVGNQNFVFGQMLPPPGYSLDEVTGLQETVTDELKHLWDAPPGSAEARVKPGGGIRNYFFVALPSFAFMGAASNDPLGAGELIPEFMRATAGIPGSIFFMSQRSIFQRRRGTGRSIDIEIKGPELERLIGLGGEIFGRVLQTLPGAQAFPIPSLDLGNPEVRVLTHRRRAAELSLSNRELGFAVSALIDGAKASDFQFQGKEIDLRLMAEDGYSHRTHLLEQMPIATPDGNLVTLGSVADISVVNGPVQINHVERQRTITIRVSPDERTELEAAIERIRAEILDPMESEGRLGGLYQVELSGTAEKLTQTLDALKWNLLLALVITYLLLAALFEDFFHPFVIMLSVPLAALGGFLGLSVVNLFTFQALDVLTMLGFIILIGTVVNNAILIVHQSLNQIRNEQKAHREAIREAVVTRMRPIFMSVSTSALGMVPLVLFPGAGSELYRGLGSVVIGGLLVSTLFTLFLVPALFNLGLDLRAALARLLSRADPSRAGISAG